MSNNKERVLAENVLNFLSDATGIYSDIKADQFSSDVFSILFSGATSSPIEDLFYIACNVWCASESMNLNPHFYSADGVIENKRGVFLEPQKQIGVYRVDFLLSQNGLGPNEYLTPVIIELDGHDFHDKNKQQRAYEKARDRFFVKSGYKVLHFTGSEVVADPYKVTHEALSMIGLFPFSPTYNPDARFGGF